MPTLNTKGPKNIPIAPLKIIKGAKLLKRSQAPRPAYNSNTAYMQSELQASKA